MVPGPRVTWRGGDSWKYFKKIKHCILFGGRGTLILEGTLILGVTLILLGDGGTLIYLDVLWFRGTLILLGDSGTLILGGTLIAGFMESAGGCGRLRRPGQLPNSVSCCLMGGRTGEGNRFTLHFSNSYISLRILWLQELLNLNTLNLEIPRDIKENTLKYLSTSTTCGAAIKDFCSMWEKLQIFGTKLNSEIWFLLIIKEWGISSSLT